MSMNKWQSDLLESPTRTEIDEKIAKDNAKDISRENERERERERGQATAAIKSSRLDCN